MDKLDQPGLFYTDMIANNAKYFSAKAAVICADQQLTWAQFHKRTNKDVVLRPLKEA